jgi:hypothetical protein
MSFSTTLLQRPVAFFRVTLIIFLKSSRSVAVGRHGVSRKMIGTAIFRAITIAKVLSSNQQKLLRIRVCDSYQR